MRMLPLQIDMYQLCGQSMLFVEPVENGLRQRVLDARESLVEQTGQDFGCDLDAWHEFLCKGDGYKWSNIHLSIASAIRKALEDPDWIAAVAAIEGGEDSGE